MTTLRSKVTGIFFALILMGLLAACATPSNTAPTAPQAPAATSTTDPKTFLETVELTQEGESVKLLEGSYYSYVVTYHKDKKDVSIERYMRFPKGPEEKQASSDFGICNLGGFMLGPNLAPLVGVDYTVNCYSHGDFILVKVYEDKVVVTYDSRYVSIEK